MSTTAILLKNGSLYLTTFPFCGLHGCTNTRQRGLWDILGKRLKYLTIGTNLFACPKNRFYFPAKLETSFYYYFNKIRK